MTDRELLEKAAKAAGYSVNLLSDDPNDWYRWDTPHKMVWNPLTDDGDALRLAVKLKIDVQHYEDHVVGWFDGGYIGTGKIPYEDDPYSATRRAIVRAAAAIGEQTP